MPSFRSALLVLLCLASVAGARSRFVGAAAGAEEQQHGVIPQPESSPSHRQLQNDELSGCEIPRAVPSPVPIDPTWQATYPGSGSRMTYFLIRALTGIMTRNEDTFHELLDTKPNLLKGWGTKKTRTDVVAVKTHYPVNNPEGFERVDDLFSRAIVIFRNPLHSIPSLFNQSYERIHRLPNHSVRGPQDDWMTWREGVEGVDRELVRFETFISFWMEKYPHREEQLLTVSYEDLTNGETGPATAWRMAQFLGMQEGVNPVSEQMIPCVWDTIVNYKNHVEEDPGQDLVVGDERGRRQLNGQDSSNPDSERSGPKVRPYSERMLGDMAAMIERLLEKYGDDEYFRTTFSNYAEEIRNTPIEEGLSRN